jgi:protease-4
MKQFFKMMFASALGGFVAIGLITLISALSFIGMIASLGAASEVEYTPKANTVFKLTLNGELSEVSADDSFPMFGGNTSALSVKDIVQAIRLAKENPNVKGIYLENGSAFSGGISSIDVIRRALEDFKESGKFIVAYADSYGQRGYYLCSVADKIMLNPSGALAMSGLTSMPTFYKGILKKAGVEMMVFKVGTFKGAVEPYLLDKLSPENRMQITSYMNSIWGNMTANMAKSRNIKVSDVNAYADKGNIMGEPMKAVEAGLIDSLKYRSEVEDLVKSLAGQDGKDLETADLDKIKRIRQHPQKSDNKVAVLYAEGEINTLETTPLNFMNQGSSITEELALALRKQAQDDDVKAVVLRVNSPGGSAYVSEQIWYELAELKKHKPVVVSMGDYAASGGYYISCAANRIFAEPTTITGSIGVFATIPNVTGLFQELDLTTDVVKTNRFGDIGDVTRPWTDEEKAIVQKYIEDSYDLFITRCADGRSIAKDSINAIGQGRVWTGEQAIKIGLVDELGGLDEAIASAADIAGLEEYEIITPSTSKTFFQKMIEDQFGSVKTSIVESVIGKEGYKHIRTLNLIKSQTGILARIPFDMELSSL